MTELYAIILFITVLLFLLGTGVWVGLALMGVAWFGMELFTTRPVGDAMVTTIWASSSSWTLTALPLFIWMGEILFRSRLSADMFNGLAPWLSWLPGRLLHVNIVGCGVMAAVAGSSAVTCATVARMSIPELRKRGYDESLSIGTLAGSGTLGLLIPPSIMLIVYAAIAELSPLRLYAAAIIPGFLLAGSYIIYVIIRVMINPSIAPKPREEDIPPRRVVYWQLLTSFVPLTVLIMLVLGSILGGLATPAEAAAMGAFGGLLLAAVYRSLNWVMLKESVYLTAKATAMVCWLFVGSWTFASVFSYLGGHEIIEHFVLGFELQPWQFLVMVQIIIFLLGWPLEWSEILIIFVPIFLPMLDTFGVNPYFFAMLVALNLQTSFLTPPMAMSAYYLKGVLGKAIELVDIFKGIIPYVFIVIFIMVMMYQFPQIALWLPDYFFGKYIP